MMIPGGWKIHEAGKGAKRSLVVSHPTIGAYVASADQNNLASYILYYLAHDLWREPNAAPQVPDQSSGVQLEPALATPAGAASECEPQGDSL